MAKEVDYMVSRDLAAAADLERMRPHFVRRVQYLEEKVAQLDGKLEDQLGRVEELEGQVAIKDATIVEKNLLVHDLRAHLASLIKVEDR